jgi:hypothetical protein
MARELKAEPRLSCEHGFHFSMVLSGRLLRQRAPTDETGTVKTQMP